MKGFSILALAFCVALSLDLSQGSRIVKRWAFFAKNDETLKEIPKNCDDIVQQYANGQLIMYEYKIKMKRCLKGLKDASRKNSITSKYDDDSSEAFFRHAMKYVNDEGSANYDEDEYEEKKSTVPAIDAAMQNAIPAATDAAAASFYPNPDQTLDQQPQSYGQSQAAFTQNAMSSQAAPEQQNYNYYTRSNIPASPQQQQQQQQQIQQDTNQQWNALLTNTKKDTLPSPADDPFASFMNMQASSNAAPQETQQRSNIPAQQANFMPAPQETQQRSNIPDQQANFMPAPQETQQRSNIPNQQANFMPAPQETQQRSTIPADAAYQTPAAQAYPANQQAFFRDHIRAWSPEDHGMFPENP